MVTVKNGKHELELKFGLGQLTSIDKALGLNVEKVNLGEGLSMLIPKLESGNIIGLAKIVNAA
ncbi:phage tail protein, partial [Staphylococcus pseudintermedius]